MSVDATVRLSPTMSDCNTYYDSDLDVHIQNGMIIKYICNI